MDKVRIKLVTLGHLPLHLNLNRVSAWRSEVFDLVGGIENFALRRDSDSNDWKFSLALLKEQLPKVNSADFLRAVANVPPENNWYARRLEKNKDELL